MNNTGDLDILGKPKFEDCSVYTPSEGNLGIQYHVKRDYDYTAPLFADITGDGILDVVFGEENGKELTCSGELITHGAQSVVHAVLGMIPE